MWRIYKYQECPKFPIAVTASNHLSLERLFWEDRIQNFAVVKIKIIIPTSLINELHLGFKSDPVKNRATQQVLMIQIITCATKAA